MSTTTPPPNDDDYPPLSALNDLLFCERRCFLHRVEGVWHENVHTTAGTLDHRRVHAESDHEQGSVRVVRGLRLVSHRLRIAGVADVVEFHPSSDLVKELTPPDDAPLFQSLLGLDKDTDQLLTMPPSSDAQIPFPIEYKRGKKRRWDNDEVQLCAQALCLEEMLGVTVPQGAIFHQKSKRRRSIVFDDKLRAQTEWAAHRLHELIQRSTSPPAILHPKCKQCSVNDVCMPELMVNVPAYQTRLNSLFDARLSDRP